MIRTTASFLSLLIVFMFAHPCESAFGQTTAYQILRRADQARGNLQGITWKVLVRAVRHDETKELTFGVKARGFDVLAETVAPPKSKGNKLLMLNGNMWFYKAGLSKAVPISRRQKLLGDAAYGDIAATNYAADYEATAMIEEVLGDEPCYVFDLQSKDKKTTYDRIRYWISKARLVGIKALYFTVSGKEFKSATMDYDNTVIMEGGPRPFISRITIYDELMSKDVTTLILRDPEFQELPNYIFNLNLLRR